MKIITNQLLQPFGRLFCGTVLCFLILNALCINGLQAQDTDGDGVSNLLDYDDDNDGLSDITEGYGFYTDGTTTDTTTGNCTGLAYAFTGGSYIVATGSGAGTLNAQYRFPNTAPGLDAIITIVQKSTEVTVVSIDQNLGDDNALQPVLNYATPLSGDFTIQLLISFVVAGTNTSATVDRVGGFIQDIDSDTGPGIREFYRVQNIVGYSIGNPTNVIPQNLAAGVVQFTADGTGSAPVEPIDISNRYRIFFQKRDTNQFLFTIGATKTSAAQPTRFYSIRFDECRIDLYNDPSHIFFNAPDTDNDTVPDYLDADSDADGCDDTIEAGYIDAFIPADKDGFLGGAIPPQVDVNGLVISGENGQGYTLPLDADSSGTWDFLENTISTACNDNDGDGIPDDIDIDDDDDGMPDTLEGTDDSDGDGIPNFLDLDADNDGTSDVVEGGNGAFDTNNDGVLNRFDTGYTDANSNGQADATEGNPVIDTDTDGIRDDLDLDSDNDGIFDVVEGLNAALDTDNNGSISISGVLAEDTDTNNNGWADAAEGNLPIDTGADGTPDYQNLDSDADGCNDANEAYNLRDADGGDGGQYGLGEPAVTDINGLVIGAPYNTGIVAAVTDPLIINACVIIDAIDDDFGNNPVEASDETILLMGNVLDNDTINAATLNPDDIMLTATPTASLAVNSDGTVEVAPNTPPGTYTIDYTICLLAEPMNCDTATVTVVVEPVNNVLVAVDDDFTDSPVAGNTGGVVPNVSVLDNDSLNGLDITLSEVTITADANGPFIINTDGTVSVNPNTPAGTYTMDYDLCEIAVPDNCATATVTVLVEISSSNNEVTIENEVITLNTSNDIFIINNIELYPDNTFEVYNRWGLKVFDTSRYTNGSNAFRGFSNGRATINKNEGLPVGVYFYILNYLRNGETKTLSGYLYVNRV